MAGPKAAGTAGGSPKHTPNQDETPAETPEANPLSAFTPAQIDQLLDVWKAQQDERADAESPGRVDSGHTLELSPAQLAGLEKLRAPFPPEAIAKRPTISCGGCKNAPNKVCSAHTKSSCEECGQYVTTAHKHLDYVGHAEATDRLLSVDLTWDWQPMAKDDKGQPLLDVDGGMWITLTVCGMTRKGYGDAVGKRAGVTATKEIIGDAIRNAGMRFGMALDLWAKTDLHAEPPHPAEPFMDAIRQERVWMSSEWLSGVRREADEAGQLDFVLPRGGGKTLGDVIDAQLVFLEDAAQRYAEMRLRRDEERAAREAERVAATAQVAAEHGVNQTPPAQAAQGPTEPPANSREDRVTAASIRVEAAEVWLNPDALQNVLTRAQSGGVANEPARPEQPKGPTLGQAMRHQITELRAAHAQRAGTAQASDAAHQYADPQDPDWRDASGYAG
ncbi:hypothetical protein [Streptomyces sp. SP17KL33]|uniref:hypothetical protein n=1 Tax=Streptomyces sp. SP17KL33 TaxID=3002534 RepID=UPI002E77DA09|nr:hypothetical protein [Streptomyces sp. SP17KL33]MEE1838122.1 hypothetical protein [Streptomyces sp. SP17KL33]